MATVLTIDMRSVCFVYFEVIESAIVLSVCCRNKSMV